MKTKQALLAAAFGALAVITAVPAAAQSTASASLGNLTWQLIDLTPDDGETPYITFTGFTSTFSTSNLYADPNFITLADTQTLFDTGSISTSVSNIDGTVSSGASLGDVSANALLMSNSGFGNAFSTQDFLLSPNTRVIFSATGMVEAMPDFFNDGFARASATLYGELFNDTSDGLNNFSSSMFSQFLREERQLIAVGQTLGLESPGWIGMQVSLEGSTLAAPVPEPASLAMLAAGLGMLGGLARRKAGRS